jgi:hypothetical protein
MDISQDPVAIIFRVEEYVYFFLISRGEVRLNPLGTSAIIWPVVPAPDDTS